MRTELGKELQKWRDDQGVSLSEMARDMGISPAYLCDIELGRRRIGFAIRKKLQIHTGLDLRRLSLISDNEARIVLSVLDSATKKKVIDIALDQME